MAESTIKKTQSNWITIWTNPNPNNSSGYPSEQRVTVDRSAYSEFCLVFKRTPTSDAQYYTVLPNIDIPSTICQCIAENIYERFGVSIGTNYIALGSGSKVTTYGARVNDNACAIPIKILAR